MKPWFFMDKIKKALEEDDSEKVGKITEELRTVIDKELLKISIKYSGLFFGILLAEATLWVEAMKQHADETDLQICDKLLSHSMIVNVKVQEPKGKDDTE